jgi:hypothetical protein
MILDFLRRPRPPRDRVCYLHIGPHKTGTTAIQHALFDKSERLAKIGLSYPTIHDADGKLRRNHSPMARRTFLRLPGALRDAPLWRELDAAIATIEGSIVVSSEHFAILLRKPDWFDRIIGFFEDRGFRVVVVAFVRDQPAWLNSWYAQEQKSFASAVSLAGFSAHVLKRGYLDPWAILGRAIDHPRIEVRALSFERACAEGLVRSFLSAVGVPRFRLREPTATNVNIGAKGVFAAQEIMRRLGGPLRGRPDYPRLYPRFLALLEGRGWEVTPYVGLGADEADAIRARFRPGNESFARAHLGAEWSAACPARPISRSVFDPTSASLAERAEVEAVVAEMVSAARSQSS